MKTIREEVENYEKELKGLKEQLEDAYEVLNVHLKNRKAASVITKVLAGVSEGKESDPDDFIDSACITVMYLRDRIRRVESLLERFKM